jgi:L-serine dehydratase
MKAISIFNDVLGPVMRGPSSSHTAAPYYIGTLARALLGGEPAAATITFDAGGSWAEVYHQQGSDLAFAAGLMGWDLTDERFYQALDLAPNQGLDLTFTVAPLTMADHPNTVEMQLVSRGRSRLRLMAKSTGGGAITISRIEGWPIHLSGSVHEVLVAFEPGAEPWTVHDRLAQDGQILEAPRLQDHDERLLLHVSRFSALVPDLLAEIKTMPGVQQVWTAPPVFFLQRGKPLFGSAAEMLAIAEDRGWSLGRTALAYEAALLGLPESDILAETIRRFKVMRAAVHRGLGEELESMQLLRPSARHIYQAERDGKLAVGGLHTRAATRAMAVMHINGGMGLVCAAPTAGSAGTIPGVLVTMAEELALSQETIALCLLAASAIGLVVAVRATFAAEVAGCQVEIGASGAMAAAAVVEAANGSARQACDAAAIAFQNSMGSVCDLVQGIVEIPCHTRNAVAASSAFVCADLVLGGYVNPIPLDETVDAVYAVGQMMPRELKVTALGGLALAPSAQAMPRLR